MSDADFRTPDTIVIFKVRVPYKSWGHDVDSQDKAREMVKRYLYGGFEIVSALFDEDGWWVIVEYKHYDGSPGSWSPETSVTNQRDRLISGGYRSEILSTYSKVETASIFPDYVKEV